MQHHTAIKALEDHGHFATTTQDGLMTTSWVRMGNAFECEEGDEWFEEVTTFAEATFEDHTGPHKADIAAWLGY